MNGIPTLLAALILAVVLFMLGILHRRDGNARRTIARLNRSNDELAREVASLELVKTRLLSRVGEALSVPLLKVGEVADELRGPGEELPEGLRETLSGLSAEVSSITRILRVFEEIASRDEDESRATGFPPVELDEMVSGAVQRMVESAGEQGVSLAVSLDPGVTVRGVSEHLSEALDSLMKEALRRAASGSVIAMTLTTEGDSACLTVSYGRNPVPRRDSVLGTGMARLIATSFGGWLNEDTDRGTLTMSLPLAEGGKG